MRGPSAHQTGPSPSQTRVGVQVNVVPCGAITAAAAMIRTSNIVVSSDFGRLGTGQAQDIEEGAPP